MTLLIACDPMKAPNIMSLRHWLEIDKSALQEAAKVMKSWIEENGDVYCLTEDNRERRRVENVKKEGPKVQYFDKDPALVVKPEDRNVGWSSAIGMVEGLNAIEMREVYDAMKDDQPMGPTVAETLARSKGRELDADDRELAEENAQVRARYGEKNKNK